MSDDLAQRARIRREVVEELRNLVGAAEAANTGNDHLLVLTDYEVANLRSALQATGYASVFRSPLGVLNTGDWLGQVYWKLTQLASEAKPNAEPDDLARRANEWRG